MTRTHPQGDYPWDCGLLEQAADDAINPIVFDPKPNEYQIDSQADGGRVE